jgi:hypothetical protein
VADAGGGEPAEEVDSDGKSDGIHGVRAGQKRQHAAGPAAGGMARRARVNPPPFDGAGRIPDERVPATCNGTPQALLSMEGGTRDAICTEEERGIFLNGHSV